MTVEWIKRRWLEFRVGYGTYLTFIFGFSNFLLLLYGLTPLKDQINFAVFSLILAAVLLPGATMIGHLHNKNQLPTEAKVNTSLNPYLDKIIPSSKEEFSNKYSVFNLEYTLWSQKLAEKNMKIMNFLLEKFHAPADFQYTDELKQIQDWNEAFETWMKRWKQYGQGTSTKEIMRDT